VTAGRRFRHGPGRAVPRAALAAAVALVALVCGCSSNGGGTPMARGTASASVPRPVPRTGPALTRTAVRYANGSRQQTLDLYLPAGDGSKVFPLVVLIHGGGFFEGTSKDYAADAELLVTRGFAAASLNYRLSGDAPFPAGVDDVKAAIRYLRAKAPGWGVDPARIAVWGDSAGGYLASMIGATAGETGFDDPALGNAGVSSAVVGVVSWYGPADFATMDPQAKEAGCDRTAQQHDAADSPESRWLGAALPTVPDLVSRASVVAHVSEAASLPPYLLVHGTADCTVAPGQSQQLYDALRAKGAQVTLTMVDGAHHGDQKIYTEQTGPTLDFLGSVLAG
jgi:acetyl esterase/lipase